MFLLHVRNFNILINRYLNNIIKYLYDTKCKTNTKLANFLKYWCLLCRHKPKKYIAMKNLVLNGKRLWMAYLEAIIENMIDISENTNSKVIRNDELISDDEIARRNYYLMRHRRIYY